MEWSDSMSWIWHNYTKDRKFFCGKNFAPYDEMNIPYNDENEAYVNVLFRFSDIFDADLIEKIDEESFNIIIHFLVGLDRLKGISTEDIEEGLIFSELISERYGIRIKELFTFMNDSDQKKILRYIRKRKKGDKFGTTFIDIFLNLFDTGEQVVFFEKSTKNTYCYCGRDDCEYNRKKFELIKLLFADINCRINELWGNCISVIGEERKYMYSVPIIDEMKIL